MLVTESGIAAKPRPVISEDRELKEIDLAPWDCRDHLEGTAKTQDGVERNRLKNRWIDAPTSAVRAFIRSRQWLASNSKENSSAIGSSSSPSGG